MIIDKTELDNFCNAVDNLEETKKGIAEDIKSTIETYSEANGVTTKSIKKYLKERKDCLKNKDDYILTDYESDLLLQISFPEFTTAP